MAFVELFWMIYGTGAALMLIMGLVSRLQAIRLGYQQKLAKWMEKDGVKEPDWRVALVGGKVPVEYTSKPHRDPFWTEDSFIAIVGITSIWPLYTAYHVTAFVSRQIRRGFNYLIDLPLKSVERKVVEAHKNKAMVSPNNHIRELLKEHNIKKDDK